MLLHLSHFLSADKMRFIRSFQAQVFRLRNPGLNKKAPYPVRGLCLSDALLIFLLLMHQLHQFFSWLQKIQLRRHLSYA
jgi:hypothetical protein